jgi:hypothetical protein
MSPPEHVMDDAFASLKGALPGPKPLLNDPKRFSTAR